MGKPDEKLQARGGDMDARVKPLVWHDFSDRGAKAQAWNQANYMIQQWSYGRWEISASYPGYSTFIEETDRFYPTLDAAKAAAQADYEARILAALEPAHDLAELVTDEAYSRFAEWFGKNYPGPDTIIHKPDWHAPKILRAAAHALAKIKEPQT